MERLHKFIARAGIASRRKAEKMIKDGMVKVNGNVIKEMGCLIDSNKDKVFVDNKLVKIENKKIYLLLNKPVAVVTSVSDPERRKTVIDLLSDVHDRVYPIGRLDFLTKGLLLLTNDGDLAYRLTHPKYKVDKTYIAIVKGIVKDKEINSLRKGVLLEDGPTLPAKVRVLSNRRDQTKLEIIIREGRNRQVRRMCQYIGHPVISLTRTAFGHLHLGNLEPGQYRALTHKEIKDLRYVCGY